MAKVTWEQSKKYEHHYIDGIDLFIRPGRSLAKIENLYRKLQKTAHKYWATACASIIHEIFAKGGKAHCKITHEFSGNYAPWWEWKVTDAYGMGLGISFNWVDEPETPINPGPDLLRE